MYLFLEYITPNHSAALCRAVVNSKLLHLVCYFRTFLFELKIFFNFMFYIFHWWSGVVGVVQE